MKVLKYVPLVILPQSNDRQLIVAFSFINLNFSFQAASAPKKAFLIGKEVNSFATVLAICAQIY